MTMRRFLTLSAALVLSVCALFHNRSNGDEATPLNTPVPSTIIATGTVTNGGTECPAVRGDDGKTYTIATPAPMPLRANTNVRAIGSAAQVSICQQGTTVKATSIENLSATVLDPTAVTVTK